MQIEIRRFVERVSEYGVLVFIVGHSARLIIREKVNYYHALPIVFFSRSAYEGNSRVNATGHVTRQKLTIGFDWRAIFTPRCPVASITGIRPGCACTLIFVGCIFHLSSFNVTKQKDPWKIALQFRIQWLGALVTMDEIVSRPVLEKLGNFSSNI